MEIATKYYNHFVQKMCQVGFIDTMQVIWGYIRNLQFNKEVPTDIELPPKYHDHKEADYKRTIGIPEWEFDIILLYSILYSPKETQPWYSLKSFRQLRLVVNDIRIIRDRIDKKILPDKKDVFKEFFRIMHRQFIWQKGNNILYTYRFYKIFSHPILSDLIKAKTNLDTVDLYRTALFFTGYFINNFSCPKPLKTEITWLTSEMFDSFVNFFGISISDFIKRYREKINFDNTFLYTFNPARTYPILIYKNNLYCPIPNYIIWKITNGIYYDLVNATGFDNAFGKSFENYCGLVLKKSLTDVTIKIFSEITYGKNGKRSSDWIVHQNNVYLFIECKAKRLKLDSITLFNSNDSLKIDLDKMVSFIFQAYKSLADGLAQKIPSVLIDDTSKIYV